MVFQIIPAIDLKEGQCVRLQQGRMQDSTIYDKKPADAAKRWFQEGAKKLHIVDLDGAFAGKPVNFEAIEAIRKQCPELIVQVGGGIRNSETLTNYFDLGVSYCIIGTSAIEDPTFLEQATYDYPNQIILGVDAKDGYVAVHGWDESSNIEAQELINKLSHLAINSVVYTDISRDGMLQGINLKITVKLAQNSTFPIIASGGVKSIDDIQSLLANKQNIAGVIAGKALYTGDLDLHQGIKLIAKHKD